MNERVRSQARAIIFGQIEREFESLLRKMECLEHREFQDRVLERGGADFCEPYQDNNDSSKNLNVHEKVLLYCRRYFRMHYDSSYKVFEDFLGACASFNPLLIDFGCGPGTSGIAFRDFMGSGDFSYVGIDRSSAMCQKAQEFAGTCDIRSMSFYEHADEFCDAIGENAACDTVIINLCFVLAPVTFRGDIEGLFRIMGCVL